MGFVFQSAGSSWLKGFCERGRRSVFLPTVENAAISQGKHVLWTNFSLPKLSPFLHNNIFTVWDSLPSWRFHRPSPLCSRSKIVLCLSDVAPSGSRSLWRLAPPPHSLCSGHTVFRFSITFAKLGLDLPRLDCCFWS